MLKKITFFVPILVLFAVQPLPAEEIMVRLANLDARVLAPYRETGFNIFSRSMVYSSGLAQALASGVVADNSHSGKRAIPEAALKRQALWEVSPDIASLLPFKARIAGKKARSGRTAWQKYILSFPQKSRYGQGLFEIMPDNSTFAAEKVSQVAVKNAAGRFEVWPMADDFFSDRDSGKRVLRMKRTAFLQRLWRKNGLQWLLGLVPEDRALAVIVLENSGDPQNNRFSDSVLLLVDPRTPPKGSGATDMSLVIGWTNDGPA